MDTPARFPLSALRRRLCFAAVSWAGLLLGAGALAEDAPEPAAVSAPAPWQLAGLKAAIADPVRGVDAGVIQICAEMGWGSLLDPAKLAAALHLQADPPTRAAAARALGQMGERGAVFAPQVAALLADSSDLMAKPAAAEALGRMGEKGAVFADRILPLLQDDLPEARDAAARSLGRMSREGAELAARVLPFLHSSRVEVRAAAILALREMGEEGVGAAPEIALHLKDQDENVRAAAAEALGQMSKAGVGMDTLVAPLLTNGDARARAGAAETLGAMGAAAVDFAPRIALLLTDSDARVRGAAAWALARMGDPGAAFAGKIAPLLEDPFPEARCQAAGALLLIGPADRRDAADAFRTLLREPSPKVRASAARMLARCGPRCAPFALDLVRLFYDQAYPVRAPAAQAFAAMGQGGAQFAVDLVTMLADADTGPWAAGALGKMEANHSEIASRVLVSLGSRQAAEDENALRLLDRLGIPELGESSREAFFARALDLLRGTPESNRPIFRAHLRLWCGTDESLQRALDWLGNPNPLPTAATLSPAQLRRVIPIFDFLWRTAKDWSPELDELSRRIEDFAPAVSAAHAPELDGAFGALRAKARAREQAFQEAERLSGPPDDRDAAPWQRGGIQAAFADASPDIHREMVKLIAEHHLGRWLPASPTLTLLADENAGTRAIAVVALGQMGSRTAAFTARILPLLGDSGGTRVITPAADALARVGAEAPEVAPRVAPLLEAPDAATRAAAVSALGRMGAHGAAFAIDIKRLLSDRDDRPRCLAIAALGNLAQDGPAFISAILPFIDARALEFDFAASALGKMGSDPASGEFVAMSVASLLEIPTPGVRKGAIVTLGRIGGNAILRIPRIAQFLPSADLELRNAAVIAIGEIAAAGRPMAGVEAISSGIVPLLKDPEISVNIMAIKALKNLARTDADALAIARQVTPLLHDERAETRAAAVDSLGEIGAKAISCGPEIVALLADKDDDVRMFAAMALGKMGGAAAPFAETLAPLLTDASVGARDEAAVALRRVGMAAPYAVKIAWLLGDEEGSMRGDAVWALCGTDDKGAAYEAQIAALLKDPAPAARGSAIEALGNMGARGAAYAGQIAPLLRDFGQYPRRDANTAREDPVWQDAVEFSGHFLPLQPGKDRVHLATVEALRNFQKEGVDISTLALQALEERPANPAPNAPPPNSDPDADLFLLHFIDDLGISVSGEKARDAWFGAALEILLGKRADFHLRFRAHLRYWCGGDARLERALDWLGDAHPTPKAAELTPAARRELLALFSDLWTAAPAARAGSPARGLDELAGRIEEIVAAIPAAPDAAPDAELAATLQTLRKQCAARKMTRQALDRALERVK